MSETLPQNGDDSEKALRSRLAEIGRETGDLERSIKISERRLRDAIDRAIEGVRPPERGIETPREVETRMRKELNEAGARRRLLREEAGRIQAELAKLTEGKN